MADRTLSLRKTRPHHRVRVVELLEPRRLFAGVTASLTLHDMSEGAGDPLPESSPGVWDIQHGTTFRVVLRGTVTSPNMTNAARSDVSLRNLPLGLQVFAADILSSGSGILAPLADTATTPPHWFGYQDVTPDGFAPSFANLSDVGADGDLDVTGAGMANLSFVLSSLSSLPRFQYGATISGATAGPMEIVLGEYLATNVGVTQLATNVVAANVFADTDPDTNVTAENVLANAVNSSITVNVTPLPASISGRVFDDKNATGFFDGDDTGISGFRVFLDQNHNEILDEGEVSKPVSGTGTFTLSGLEPGTYRLRQVSRQGWRVSNPGTGDYDVTLRSGDTAKSLSFANTQGVLIKGTVWHDSNVDRIKQDIESPLAGWRVIVDLNKNGIWDGADVSKETNSKGQYRLSVLDQVGGSDTDLTEYHVMVKQVEGWRQTTNGGSHTTIFLAPGGTTSNKNFGLKRLKTT